MYFILYIIRGIKKNNEDYWKEYLEHHEEGHTETNGLYNFNIDDIVTFPVKLFGIINFILVIIELIIIVHFRKKIKLVFKVLSSKNEEQLNSKIPLLNEIK